MTDEEVYSGSGCRRVAVSTLEESLQHMAAAGFDIILGRRTVAGGTGLYVALEHEDADEFPEFYAMSFADAVTRARGWIEREMR
jgi:hypothetical protein